MHDDDHGNQGTGTRCRPAWNERLSAKGNVERRAAPDRRITFGNPYSVATKSSAARSARANRAQLSGAQKSAAGNPSTDEVFLGRVGAVIQTRGSELSHEVVIT